jgi:hypothetical protein
MADELRKGPSGPIANIVVDNLPNQQNVIYVGKHGSDLNNGLKIEAAKLTFDAALILAASMVPAVNNRVAIICLDAGIYVEAIGIPPFVVVYAPNATLVGNLVLADESSATFGQVATASGVAVEKAGTLGVAYFESQVIALGATAIGFLNGGAGSTLVCRWKEMSVSGGFGIGDLTTAQGHTHVDGEDIYLDGDGYAMAHTGSGSIVGRISHILERGAGIGNGTGIIVLQGSVKLLIDEISANVAWDVRAGAELDLLVNKVSGELLTTATSIVHVTNDPHVVNQSRELNLSAVGPTTIFSLPIPDDTFGSVSIDVAAENLGNRAQCYTYQNVINVSATAGAVTIRDQTAVPLIINPGVRPVDVTFATAGNLLNIQATSILGEAWRWVAHAAYLNRLE